MFSELTETVDGSMLSTFYYLFYFTYKISHMGSTGSGIELCKLMNKFDRMFEENI